MDLTKLPDFKNKITQFGENWQQHNGAETQEFLERKLLEATGSRFGAIRKFPGEGGKMIYRFFADEASADKYEADTTTYASLCLDIIELQASEVTGDDRYMPRTEAYTKTQADAKFAAKTEVTGLVEQAVTEKTYTKTQADTKFATNSSVDNVAADFIGRIGTVSTEVTSQGTRITALENAPDAMPIVEQTEATATIQPDVLNKWGEVATLTIDLAEGAAGYAHEYCIEFVSGETATTLSLPETVKFPDEPTIEANMRYQISIVNNIALIAGVATETEATA